MARPAFGYRNASGEKILGSTSVLKYVQTMDGDILCSWAAKLARQGKGWREERSVAGAHGTVLHELCEKRLPNPLDPVADRPTDETWARLREAHAAANRLADAAKLDALMDEAWVKLQQTYAAIREWWLKTKPRIILAEVPLVSEMLQFGGTLDGCVEFEESFTVDTPLGPVTVNAGEPWLLDYKSGSQVGAKECAQMASYRDLLDECKGIRPKGAVLIHAPTKEPGYMRPVWLPSSALDLGRDIFMAGMTVARAIPQLSRIMD